MKTYGAGDNYLTCPKCGVAEQLYWVQKERVGYKLHWIDEDGCPDLGAQEDKWWKVLGDPEIVCGSCKEAIGWDEVTKVEIEATEGGCLITATMAPPKEEKQ